jgi:hypothetical protein
MEAIYDCALPFVKGDWDDKLAFIEKTLSTEVMAGKKTGRLVAG